MRDAFEHGPHDLGAAGAAGEPEAACRARRSPRRACRGRAAPARTRRRRCRRTATATSCDSRRRRDEPEVVAQPLHVGAGREHDRLDAPRDARRRAARRRSGTCRPRRGARTPGARRRGTRSSMPPVPNVILAMPGPHAALADERRLLVAGERGDRRRARQRGAPRRRRPTSRRSRGSIAAGMPSASSTRVVPTRCRRRRSRPVTAALVASVTCSAPSDSVHAIQVSTVPKHEVARARRGRAVSSSHASLVADWFGADAQPSAVQHEARRRPCAGPASRCPGRPARPSARSHTIVDARWLEMPTASTGPPSSSAAARELERGVGHGRRVELDEARRRASRAAARGSARARRRASGARRGAHAARADVDDEDAHGRSLG